MSTNPIPTTSFTLSTNTGLIGETIKAVVNFKNTSSNLSALGYAGGSDIFIQKGLSNISTSGFVASWVYTLDSSNNPVPGTGKWVNAINGTGTTITAHPFSANGLTLPADPNDAGQYNTYRWYVYSTGYSSYGPDQPEDPFVEISASVSQSDGAFPGNTYKLKSRPWFRYGTSAVGTLAASPAIIGSNVSSTVTSTLVRVKKTNTLAESEVASGPNFPFIYNIKVDISQGAVLSNLKIVDTLSHCMLLYDPNINSNTSNLGTITDSTTKSTITANVVNSRKNLTVPSLYTPVNDQSFQHIIWDYTDPDKTITGLGGNDINMSYRVYVPYSDVQTGNPILSPDLMASKSVTQTVTCGYNWNLSSYTSTANNTVTIKQITVNKRVTSGANPLIPLSIVTYANQVNVSDFFALKNIRLEDVLSDGHFLSQTQKSYTNFSATYKNGLDTQRTYLISQSDITFTDYVDISDTDNPNYLINKTPGTTVGNRYMISFNLDSFISQANVGESRSTNLDVAKGGLVKYGNIGYADPYSGSNRNFSQVNSGPCSFIISYLATIDQLYYGRTASISNLDGSNNKLDIGDVVNSSVTIKGHLFDWNTESSYLDNSLGYVTSSDSSNTQSNIGSATINKSIYAITRNGSQVDLSNSANLKLVSGDLVTYRLKINLSHQNFLNFTISDYLPPPVISVASMSTAFNTSSPSSSLPNVNTMKYGPDHTFNTFKHPNTTTIASGPNSVKVSYQNYQNPYIQPANIASSNNIRSQVIDILYTLLVTSQPTADGFVLTNQGVFKLSSNVGNDTSGVSSTGIILNQPYLKINKGVVAFTNVNKNNVGTVLTNTPPITCSVGTKGFTGGPITPLSTAINAGVNNLDRGSKVKYCITIMNTGSTTAFDVMIRDSTIAATGQSILDTSSLELRDGSNNLLDFVDPTPSKLYSTTGIGIGSIPANGVRLIFYEAIVLSGPSFSTISSNQKLTNTASIRNYTNITNGINFYSQYLLSATATCNFRNVSISRNITYRSENPTNLASRVSDNISIGEIFRIVSVVTIPIGTLPDMVIRDQLNDLVAATNSGMKSIYTKLSTSDTSFTGDVSTIVSNATKSGGLNYYTIGSYNNTTALQDNTFTLVQYIQATNEQFNSKFILGQNTYVDRLLTQSSSYAYVYVNTNTKLATSNVVNAVIKEPKLSFTKAFNTSPNNYSKSDTFAYKLTLQSVSQSTGFGPQNVVIYDTMPSQLTLINGGTTTSNNSLSITDGSTYFTYTIGSMTQSQSLNYYINCRVNTYQSGDTVTNTAYVDYKSLNSAGVYVAPTDDASVSSIIPSTTRVCRSYTSNAYVSFTTWPSLTHTLTNDTYTNDSSYPHPVVSGKVTGTISDTLKTIGVLNLPKGFTYVKNLYVSYPDKLDNIIPSTDQITITLPTNVSWVDSNNVSYDTITITPFVNSITNQVIMQIDKQLFNNNSSFANIQIPYTFVIKNTNKNIKGFLSNITWSFNMQNTSQLSTVNTTSYNSTTGLVGYYVVEPSIAIKQVISQIPLTPTDSYQLRINLQIDNSTYSTTAFNPMWYFTLPNNINSNITQVSVPSNWSVTQSDNVYTFKYNGSSNNGINKNLSPGASVDFYLGLTPNNGSTLTYGDYYTTNVRVTWTSKNSGSADFVLPSADSDIIAVRTYSGVTTNNTINNYTAQDNVNVYIEQQFEAFEFGLAFEDALDFDYDYNDAVFNTNITIVRNKFGIKRFVGDFALVTRGAAYDHTFGLRFDGLKSLPYPDTRARSGSWDVMSWNGEKSESINGKSSILSYLKQSPTSNCDFTILRADDLPLIISTKQALPPDAIYDNFSANTHNRTLEIPTWINPYTTRVIIDFDDNNELIMNGKYPIPYIDVRGGKNNKVTPVYNDYEYRHSLGSIVDFSRKTFTYNGVEMTFGGFPKVLITPCDFIHCGESGEYFGDHPIIETYTDFVNYVTNGRYPRRTNMVNMTDIRNCAKYVRDRSAWFNDESKIKPSNLMKFKKIEYDNDTISSKPIFNEYRNNHTMLMGIIAKPKYSIDQIAPGLNRNISIKINSNDSGTIINEYIKKVGDKKIANITKTLRNGIFAVEYDSVKTSGKLIGSTKSDPIVFNTRLFEPSIVSAKGSVSHIAVIDDKFTVLSSDETHDTTVHNNERKVTDVCYVDDKYILSTSPTNDLIITSIDPDNYPISNINLEGIDTTKIMSLLNTTSNNIACIVTTTGEIYLIDTERNQSRIFESYTITNIDISDSVVLGVTSDSEAYSYDISSGVSNLGEPVLVGTNVCRIAAGNNWGAFIDIGNNISTFGNVPDGLTDAIVQYTLPTDHSALCDIAIVDDTIVVCYV